MARYVPLLVASCLVLIVVAVPLAGATQQWAYSVTLSQVFKQPNPDPASTPHPSPTPTTIPIDSLGSIRFTTDPSQSQSVAIPAEGSVASLAVTDVEGLRWSLDVPGDDLLAGQTISMTAFATLDTSSARAPVSRGVLFEPDGLRFAQPMTLTVTVPDAWTGVGLMFSTAADGSGLDFAPLNVSGRTYTSPVWHFSTRSMANLAQERIAGMSSEARIMYNAARELAQAFTDQYGPRPPHPASAPAPPAPSPFSMLCYGTSSWDLGGSKQRAIRDYPRDFLHIYDVIAEPLLGRGNAAWLLGNDDGGEASELYGQVYSIAVQSAIDQLNANENPDAILPLVAAALHAANRSDASGGDVGGYQARPAIAAAFGKARDKLFTKLIVEHRYSALPAILELEGKAVFWEGNISPNVLEFLRRDMVGGLPAEYLQKVAKAMTFEVTIDNVADIVDQHARYDQRGENISLPMNPEPPNVAALIPDPKAFRWDVEATVDYTFGRYWGDGGQISLRLPQSYTTWMRILRFDPCGTKTLDFDVDKWGTASEVWLAEGYEVSLGSTADTFFTVYWFTDHRQTDDGFWRFELPIEDGNELMSDETFRAQIVAPQYVESRQQLKHKPQAMPSR